MVEFTYRPMRFDEPIYEGILTIYFLQWTMTLCP